MRSDILVPTIPAALILLACAGWSAVAWVALAYLTVGTAIIDALASPDSESKAASPNVSLFLGCLHFPVLFACVVATSTASAGEVAVLFLATGLYLGQVSNSAAHELIHSRNSLPRSVGRWVYISLLFGHHASAHTKIHHRYVATPDDPNSARPGETLYRFIPRAWIGSFRRGLVVETEALRSKCLGATSRDNPYWIYVFGSCATLLVSFALAGSFGVVAHVGLACWATTQLLAADYVQHYGLRRKETEAGYEKIGLQHSWNAPKIASVLLMQQAPLHSAHHTGQSLAGATGAQPILPFSLPAMVTLAFFPRSFRRVMNRALANLARPGEPFDRTSTEMPA